MPTPTDGLLRLVRALLVAAACTGMSLAGHLVGGGLLPSVGTLGVAAGGTTVCTWTLSRRRWSFATLLAALGVAEVALHLVFEVGTGAGTAGGGAGATDVAMPLAHGAAALLLAAALAHGEALLWDLVALLAALVTLLVRRVRLGPVTVPSRPRLRPGPARCRPRSPLLTLTAPRRGPPACTSPA